MSRALASSIILGCLFGTAAVTTDSTQLAGLLKAIPAHIPVSLIH